MRVELHWCSSAPFLSRPAHHLHPTWQNCISTRSLSFPRQFSWCQQVKFSISFLEIFICGLKVMSTTTSRHANFIIRLIERPFRNRKNAFYFTSKILVVLEILIFLYFFLPLAAFLLENLTEIETSWHDVRELHDIFKIQNICNLIGGNSMHIFGISNCCSENISGMWNTGKWGEIYKTFEFILT